MARKRKWTEEAVLEEIKRIMQLLDIKVLPRYKDIKQHSTCTEAYTKYGGASWASKVLGVPLSGGERTKWREDTLLAEVKRVMREYDLHDRLPTYNEFEACSTCWSALRKHGGLEWVSEVMGLPFIKKESTENNNASLVYRPSAAFDKVRRSKKRYSEIQKEDSLKLAGKIDVSKYAGMKTWKERMAEDAEK